MVNSFLIGAIFIVALLISFYILFRNGFDNVYFIILFCFLLASWIVPMVFFTNKNSFGVLPNNSINWLIVGTIYFLVQFVIRFLLIPLKQWIKSLKKIIFGIFVVYSILIFISIFIGGVSSVIILLLGATLFTSLYGLQAKYWLLETGTKYCYLTTMIIIILPLLGILAGKFIQSFYSGNLKWEVWRQFLIAMLAITIVVTILLWFFKEKIRYSDSKFFKYKNNEQFKFEWGKFKMYPIMIGLLSFSKAIIFNSLIENYDKNPEYLLAYSTIIFIIFLFSLLAGGYLIKMKSAYFLNNIGIGLMMISFFISILPSIILKIDNFSLIFTGFVVFIIGYAMNHMALYGDILHIEKKTGTMIVLAALSFESLFQCLGFFIGHLINFEIKNDMQNIFEIVFFISILATSAFLILNIIYKKTIINNRQEFLNIEFNRKTKINY